MESQDQPKLSILVAEDDAALRKMVTEILNGAGYHVISAKDGKNALNVARQHEGRIELLVTDVMMPKVDGFDLRERILRERNDLKVLVMSGNLDPEIVGEDFPIIRKPFKREEFLDKVRSLLARPAGSGSR